MEIYIILLFSVSFCQADIYVNQETGHDTLMCGYRSQPCMTLEHALSLDRKSIQSESIILEPISSSYTMIDTFLITKDVHIKGSSDFPDAPKLVLRSKPAFVLIRNAKLNLHFLHISEASRLVEFKNSSGNLIMSKCVIDQARELVKNEEILDDGEIKVNIDSSKFSNCLNALYFTFDKSHIKKSLSIAISNSTFIGTAQKISNAILVRADKAMKRVYLNIKESSFEHFGQALRVSTNQDAIDFSITNSLFENNNLYENNTYETCPQCIEFCGSAIKYFGRGRLIITGSIFKNNVAVNGGAVCFSGIKTAISDSKFIDNKASSKGGGVYSYNSSVSINNSRFQGNLASSLMFERKHKRDYAEGFGGAIFNTLNAILMIDRTVFIDNSAFVFGGSIYHGGSRASFKNSEFQTPKENEKSSLHGTLLYTKKRCILQNTIFTSTSTEAIGTVIFHSSDDEKLTINPKFQFNCQRGQQIIRSYNHRPKKTEFSLFIMICQPCPAGTYSLQRETLNFNHIIKESSSNTKCIPCPQGGVCKNGIRSLPSFWGWETKNRTEIKFLSCPSSTYCCSQQSCDRFNGCSKKRVGRLCGKCKSGFSESMFGSECIPNEACDGYLLWSIFVIVSLSYVFVFMYFKDIFSLGKRVILKPIEYVKRVRAERNSFSSNVDSVDDLDLFYVDADHNGEHTPTRVDQRPSFENDIDETDIMSSISLNGDEIDGGDLQEPLINSNNDNNESKQTRVQKTKSKWYSYLFGIFKILVFFYQMQLLSKIPSVLENSYQFVGPSFIKEFVTGIFNLKVSDSLFLGGMCLFKDMDPVSKKHAKILFILLPFCALILFYATWRLIMFLKRSIFKTSSKEVDVQKRRTPYTIRIKCCTLQLLLIAYSTICATSLNLISCVKINDVSYVYINAERQCQGFAYNMSYAIVVCWSVPFFIALYVGNWLLRESKISVNEFLAILIFPPFFIFYAGRNIIRGNIPIDYCKFEKETREHVLQVLEMPFHKKNAFRSAWYWEVVLVFRKLVLVSIYVYFTDPISRLYTMVIPLSLFLVDHLRVQPYNIKVLNWLETASLLLLSFLISINLFWAYNYESDVAITAEMTLISKSFLYIETIILFTPILLVFFLIAAAVAKRILRKLKR